MGWDDLASDRLRGKTRGVQRLHDLGYVRRPAGLQHQLDLDVLRGERGERALVMHFLDVGSGVCHRSSDQRKRTRHVAGRRTLPRS